MFNYILFAIGIFISSYGISDAVELEFTIEIDPARRECFHQEIKQGTSFEFEYQVVDGGDMDISCHITSPSGKTLVSEMKQTESDHNISLPFQDFLIPVRHSVRQTDVLGFTLLTVCLFVLFNVKVIEGGEMDVNVMIHSPSGTMLVTDIRKTDSVHRLEAQEAGDYTFCLDNTFSRFSSKLVFFELITDDQEASLSKIHEHIDKGKQIQNILRAIETRDRSLAEANFERVNFWSGVQVFVMVSVAVTHVLMIRSLFEDRRKGPLKMRT
ncbi:hypothetical protein LSH36_20g10054 [Paralvinella palmiformis]|uniref:GOLD domain-containing protein n=1 Tax=Paralvinella palmiformis TaxID=53620 RepID=A0AAD9KAJ4_9ANNE|nr:hypothetical protein LSH36_20g10054 [Paralvinella palmiformis]